MANFVELTDQELIETEGGIWPLIVVGALLLASCQNNANTGSGTQISVSCTNCNVTTNVANDTINVQVTPKK